VRVWRECVGVRTRSIVKLSAIPSLLCAATHFIPEIGEPCHFASELG
jgi:hypothetical protein